MGSRRHAKDWLVLSAVVAAVGMQVDVCSGPLPPVQGLHELCRLVVPGWERGEGPVTCEASADATGSGRQEGGSPRGKAPPLLCAAIWPVPLHAYVGRSSTPSKMAVGAIAVSALARRAPRRGSACAMRLDEWAVPWSASSCRLKC